MLAPLILITAVMQALTKKRWSCYGMVEASRLEWAGGAHDGGGEAAVMRGR